MIWYCLFIITLYCSFNVNTILAQVKSINDKEQFRYDQISNDLNRKYQMIKKDDMGTALVHKSWHNQVRFNSGYYISGRDESFNNLIDAPKLISPSDSSYINKPIMEFEVPRYTDGDSLLHIKVEIARDSSFEDYVFGSPFESSESTSGFDPSPPFKFGELKCEFTYYPFSLRDSVTYYWRVTAYDNNNNYGEPSEVYRFIIDKIPPPKPINFIVNGTTQRTWQLKENRFTIFWENPSDISGIVGYYYKLGEEPDNNDDFYQYHKVSENRLDVDVIKEKGQMLHIWMEDGAGNTNYQNRASVNLIYYEEQPKVFIKAPKDNVEVGKQVVVLAKNYTSVVNYTLAYRQDSQASWDLISSIDTTIAREGQIVELWNCPLDSGEVQLRLIVQDSSGISSSDSVKFMISDKPVACIVEPENNAFVHDSVSIRGIIIEENFKNYSIDLMNQSKTTVLLDSIKNKKNDLELFKLNTLAFSEEEHLLCLTIRNQAGIESKDIITVNIDNTPPIAEIISPASDDTISCTVDIQGNAYDKNFKQFSLKYAKFGYQAPNQYELIANTFGSWDTKQLNGPYKLRLSVEDRGGLITNTEKELYISNPKYNQNEGLNKRYRNNVELYLPPGGYRSSIICIDSTGIDNYPYDASICQPTDLIFNIQSDIEDSTFSKPAILSIAYDNSSQYDEDNLRIFNYKNREWRLIGGKPETGKKIIRTFIDGIGIYGLFESRIPPGNIEKELIVNCQPRVFSPRGNGFDTETSIIFDLGEPADVTIKIYNTASRLIRLLRDNESRPDGRNVVEWDGRDQGGDYCVTGLYIVAVQAQDKMATNTVAVLNK